MWVTMRNDVTLESYEKIASHYARTHFSTKFWIKEYKIFKKLVGRGKILDVGCGGGRDAVLFVRDNFDYVGIDGSRNMIKIARNRVKKGKFLTMNFYQMHLPNKNFDGFWAAATILHIPKRKVSRVLNSIKKILKPEGMGFISIKEKRKMNEGIIKEKIHGGIERYFAFYTEKEFRKIIEKNGFEVVRSHIKKEDGTNWLCFFVKRIN